MRLLFAVLIFIGTGIVPASTSAQQAPGIGYMFPPGGAAGTTVEVVLGGYDWTPDMQVFVVDPRIKLDLISPPGPVIVPEPPYWFGKKARRPPFLLPRETRARLTLPAGFPPGVVHWQAANANGATQRGRFVVGTGSELLEVQTRKSPQELPTLPVTISGRIQNIEEVDRYRFIAARTGPITCRVAAKEIGSPLNAVVEVRNASGRLVADAADTSGRDVLLTFAANKGAEYTVSVYDVDFRGNRAFVYRLNVIPGPGVLAAIPSAGNPGETKAVEFIGYGVATGGAQLESVMKTVTFPAKPSIDDFRYSLQTAWGTASPYVFLISDLPESVEPASTAASDRKLAIPAAVTGTIEERYGIDRYLVSGKKGDVWTIACEADRIGSPLDVSVTILDADGKQIHTIDDLPGTVDAGFEFKVPNDGDYEVLIGDNSGRSGNRAATYRLVVRSAVASFYISVPELLAIPAEGKSQLTVTVKRHAGFKDAIAIAVTGLPVGVEATTNVTIPADKNAVKIDLTSTKGSAVSARMVSVSGTAAVAGKQLTRSAGRVLVAVTLKPPFSIDAEGKDDVTKWPRGSTFPGPVLIERDEGFNGEIVLEMSSKQGRHRQGIRGPELVVPPGVKRILYPVFLPEWLETTRTSRMVVNGVARVPDAKGNLRYCVSRLKTRIGFLPGGALLKISIHPKELELLPGRPFEVSIIISRSRALTESAKLELKPSRELAGMFQFDPVIVDANTGESIIRVTPVDGRSPVGEQQLTVRATVLKDGKYHVVSEAHLLLVFPDEAALTRPASGAAQ
jgi:hypothetical protein